MTQEKRTLLAIGISIGILIGYNLLFPPKPPQPSPIPVVSDSRTEPSPTSPAVSGVQVSAPASEAGLQVPQQLMAQTTPYAAFEWSNWGGDLLSWTLLHYRQTVEKESPPVDLVRGSDKGLEHLTVNLMQSTSPFPETPQYQVVSATDRELVLAWQSAEMKVTSFYSWHETLPIVEVRVRWENLSSHPMTSDITLRFEDVPTPPSEGGFLQSLQGPPNIRRPLGYWAGKRHLLDDKKKDQTFEGNVYWGGIEDRYFLAALLPVDRDARVTLKNGADKLAVEMTYPGQLLAAGQSSTYAFKAYLGPKEREALLAIGARLEAAIDHGWFSAVAVPILWLLKAFHSFLHNWGLAIIVLTIFIKILLTPITNKSMKSMKAMQNLQPELAKLREKYKDNRERLNLEMMQLFKTYKVNPVGGCLPMLLQMPIYIALYKVLYSSIELYHSPFGPYRDLAAPDPYFIAPILLGVFMVLQQKLTPSTTADPAQQKMMMLMPVMFSVFMLFLPVGLVVYIFVNTFMSVIQQWMMRKDLTMRLLLRRAFVRK